MCQIYRGKIGRGCARAVDCPRGTASKNVFSLVENSGGIILLDKTNQYQQMKGRARGQGDVDSINVVM